MLRRHWKTFLVFGLMVLAEAASVSADVFHVGLDFIESDFQSEHFGTFIGSEWEGTFHPVAMTDPASNAVTGGALAGWTEQEVRRAVTAEVDSIFRSVTDAATLQTLSFVVHQGVVPEGLSDRRLNVILGSHDWMGSLTLGGSIQAAATNTQGVPNDDHAAFVLLDNIDSLPDVTFTTAQEVIHAIAGTTCHEIGHLFDLTHVNVSSSSPQPIMATHETGLTTAMRLQPRAFSRDADAQGDMSSAEKLIDVAGVMNVADVTLDNQVTASGDGGVLLSNLGLDHALWQDGDLNGDGFVTAAGDGALLLASLPLAAAPTPEPTTISILTAGLLGILYRRKRV